MKNGADFKCPTIIACEGLQLNKTRLEECSVQCTEVPEEFFTPYPTGVTAARSFRLKHAADRLTDGQSIVVSGLE